MRESVTIPPERTVEEARRVPARRLLSFEVGGSVFACDMEAFREIVPAQRTPRLPGAPETVCGLVNLRGTIVTVIDGGVVLGKRPCARTSGLILLADYFDRLVGVGVDDVRDIHDVPIDQFAGEDAPESIADGLVTGFVEIEGKRVIVLDIKALVQKVIGQGR